MNSYYEKMAECAKISTKSREIEKVLIPNGFLSRFKKVDCTSALNDISDLRDRVRDLISDFDSASSDSPEIDSFIASIKNYLNGLYMSFVKLSMVCKSLDKKQKGDKNNYKEDIESYSAHLMVFNEMAEETAELFKRYSNELRANGIVRR